MIFPDISKLRGCRICYNPNLKHPEMPWNPVASDRGPVPACLFEDDNLSPSAMALLTLIYGYWRMTYLYCGWGNPLYSYTIINVHTLLENNHFRDREVFVFFWLFCKCWVYLLISHISSSLVKLGSSLSKPGSVLFSSAITGENVPIELLMASPLFQILRHIWLVHS